MKLSPERLGVIIALTAAACFALANSITVVAYRGGSNPLRKSKEEAEKRKKEAAKKP